MAPRVRRRMNQVPDSESDEEDPRVVNDSLSTAEPIDISDDEVHATSPPHVPLPQQMPAARHPVQELLQNRGVAPRPQWLESCLSELAASHPGFTELPVPRQAELCFGQFLMADFNVAGAASLPPSMHALHGTELPGPFVLQVDEVTDISRSLRDRYQEKPAGPGRTLKLSMTDGVQRVSGMEYRPIRALQVLSPAGMKISLKNVCVRRGLLMLVPEILEILGGCVEHLESARLRAVQLITKPPRGRRTRQGTVEPSLFESATRAAWPAELAQGAGAPPGNLQPEQHRSHAGSADAPSGNTHQPEQRHRPNGVSGNAHQGSRPANSASDAGLHHPTREAVQQGAERRPMWQNQPVQSSGQSAQVSNLYHSVRADSVQQPQPMQQDEFTLPSRQSFRHSGLQSVGLETVQQVGHHQPIQHQAAEVTRESIRVSGGHTARLEQVHQSEQYRTTQQGQGGVSSRQSISHTVQESTSTRVSAERNAQLPSTPTFSSSLSSQSRRLVQSKLPSALTMQRSSQADGRPLQSAGTADVATPMDSDDRQESGQHTSAISSTPPSRADSFAAPVPFTYLAVLKGRADSQMGHHGVVRGKVKCVITGVIAFHFKEVDDFKLCVCIEDGSSIAEANVHHQLVQRLVGFSRREVVSALQDLETRPEMMDNLIRFQKLLAKFEGYMDVEFSHSSTKPTILEMTEGVQLADVKLLCDRVRRSMTKQTPNTNGHIPTIDLSTP